MTDLPDWCRPPVWRCARCGAVLARALFGDFWCDHCQDDVLAVKEEG